MGEKENSNKLVISFDTKSLFKVIFVILLFVTLFILRDIVLVVLTAVLIASAIEPITKWFGHYRIPRLPAVLTIYLGGIIVLAGAFYFLFLPLLGDASDFLKNVPEQLAVLEIWNPLQERLLGGKDLSTLSEKISVKEIVDQANLALAGTSNFLGVASTLFGGILSMVLIIVLSFYLSVQEKGIIKFLRIITPLKYEDYVLDLWRRAEIKIGLWFQGQVVLVLVIGVLTYLGLVLLGVPNALLLASFSAIMEIIPVFGPVISAVPAIILGFVHGGVPLALMVAGLYLIIQQFENHLIYPLVVQKIVGLSPILVILALIAGFKLAGFLGMLLCVPVVAVFMIFVDDIESRKSKLRQSKT